MFSRPLKSASRYRSGVTAADVYPNHLAWKGNDYEFNSWLSEQRRVTSALTAVKIKRCVAEQNLRTILFGYRKNMSNNCHTLKTLTMCADWLTSRRTSKTWNEKSRAKKHGQKTSKRQRQNGQKQAKSSLERYCQTKRKVWKVL